MEITKQEMLIDVDMQRYSNKCKGFTGYNAQIMYCKYFERGSQQTVL